MTLLNSIKIIFTQKFISDFGDYQRLLHTNTVELFIITTQQKI